MTRELSDPDMHRGLQHEDREEGGLSVHARPVCSDAVRRLEPAIPDALTGTLQTSRLPPVRLHNGDLVGRQFVEFIHQLIDLNVRGFDLAL